MGLAGLGLGFGLAFSDGLCHRIGPGTGVIE